jgi:oxygen-independent coproporphyrinogen-3 oxidase
VIGAAPAGGTIMIDAENFGAEFPLPAMNTMLALAERSVPRYTSYPTVPHFSADIVPRTYATWLDALPRAATLSLYLHVPFCTELCRYCGCTTKAVRRRAPVEAYATLLRGEIGLISAATRARRVVHLHWGGGTPTILGADRLAAVVETLTGAFDLAAVQEHAIELDPRHLDAALASALARMGVTRASLGVQDFSPHVQRAIGRTQPFEQVEQAVTFLRDVGIANINIDLTYGLPRQTIGDVIRSAELAASLKPARLALFGYAHVPWFKPHQRLIDEAALPGPGERLAQMHAAAEMLEECGYVPIGLDHFALPGDELSRAVRGGRLHRNFQGYSSDSADVLVGLGASAIGRLPQGYVQNASDIGAYARAIEAEQFATARGFELSGEDRLRARIIERLMCDLAVDLDADLRAGWGAAAQVRATHFCAMLAGDIQPRLDFAVELAALDNLGSTGIVRRDGRRIYVTEAGRPFVRLVAAAFDAYLPKDQKQHSAAV